MKSKLFNGLIVIAILLFLNSCTVHKYPSAYDGSKADGTVTMFYEYGVFVKPVVHWDEAKQQAISKCKNWGYSGAEFFGSGVQKCIAVNGYGNCIRWRVYYKCQCTE